MDAGFQRISRGREQSDDLDARLLNARRLRQSGDDAGANRELGDALRAFPNSPETRKMVKEQCPHEYTKVVICEGEVVRVVNSDFTDFSFPQSVLGFRSVDYQYLSVLMTADGLTFHSAVKSIRLSDGMVTGISQPRRCDVLLGLPSRELVYSAMRGNGVFEIAGVSEHIPEHDTDTISSPIFRNGADLYYFSNRLTGFIMHKVGERHAVVQRSPDFFSYRSGEFSAVRRAGHHLEGAESPERLAALNAHLRRMWAENRVNGESDLLSTYDVRRGFVAAEVPLDVADCLVDYVRLRTQERPVESEPQAYTAKSAYAAGARIVHSSFGSGVVVRADKSRIDVDFGTQGVKKLAHNHKK